MAILGAQNTRLREKSTSIWRKLTYEDIIAGAKLSLDIFWIRDESQADLDNLPDRMGVANGGRATATY